MQSHNDERGLQRRRRKEREIRPHIQIQATTLHPQPPVPPPSVHVPLPATPQQQGPEPPLRSQSITGEREKETDEGTLLFGSLARCLAGSKHAVGQTSDDDDDSHQGCSSLPPVHSTVRARGAGAENGEQRGRINTADDYHSGYITDSSRSRAESQELKRGGQIDALVYGCVHEEGFSEKNHSISSRCGERTKESSAIVTLALNNLQVSMSVVASITADIHRSSVHSQMMMINIRRIIAANEMRFADESHLSKFKRIK
ncbi:hypothetical protein F2P81_001623 [Scophthalmus maximus]|uniref:Uncharacterized protein n=1 Tax=Scophthalmus maximus TaxID=52904 RepID=A0A6A4TPE5_SCOMX|nr:hypothetical protein F2P81_001623 [Scophthalmus maximus]